MEKLFWYFVVFTTPIIVTANFQCKNTGDKKIPDRKSEVAENHQDDEIQNSQLEPDDCSSFSVETGTKLKLCNSTQNAQEWSRTLIIKSQSSVCNSIRRYYLNYTGQEMKVTSPNWPFPYMPNLNCTYFFSSPQNTRMKMVCHISMPHKFLKCKKTGDLFQYSLDGDENFNQQNTNTNTSTNTNKNQNKHQLCGKHILTTFSTSNNLSFALKSGPLSIFSILPSKRNFKCKIKVIKSKTVSPPVQPPVLLCGTRVNKISTHSKPGSTVLAGLEKIKGGSSTQVGELPWRCALQIRKNGIVTRNCTCSIISTTWILSSTHCVMGEQAADIFIRVGTTVINDNSPQSPPFLQVSQVIPNTKYGPGQNDDTSLVKLSQPLVFSSNVNRICLPCQFKGQQFIGATMFVSGFVEQSPGMHTLLQKTLPVMDRAACRAIYPINNDEICMYEPGTTTCDDMGDPGSFADFMDPSTGTFYAAGIFSWGKACSSTLQPSVHQNVARYIDWIETNTGETFCPM